jgi:hypothetical protein
MSTLLCAGPAKAQHANPFCQLAAMLLGPLQHAATAFMATALVIITLHTGSVVSMPNQTSIAPPYTAAAPLPGFSWLPGYDVNTTGTAGSLNYTVQLVNTTSGANVSAWHDLPLGLQLNGSSLTLSGLSNNTLADKASSISLWVVTEIARGETAKFETMTSQPGNPIRQDSVEELDAAGEVVDERPRYYQCAVHVQF